MKQTQWLFILFALLMIETQAFSITCETDCGSYSKESWTCGIKFKNGRPKEKKCSVVNPLKRASCEAQKTSHCLKNKIADWVEDRFAEDSGNGPAVKYDSSYMQNWSPGLLPNSSDCIGHSAQSDKILQGNLFYSTDREQSSFQFTAEGDNSTLCGIDFLKNKIKSKGLWVCEDPRLFKDIHDGRQGAYYIRASHHKVCQLRWRHLPNGWKNGFQRSRTIMECAETHGARSWTGNGEPLTFICKDMAGDMARIAQEQNTSINDAEYKQRYLDEFARAVEEFNIEAFPQFELQTERVASESVGLYRSEGVLSNLNDENQAIIKENDRLIGEAAQVEKDSEELRGALEKRKEYQTAFKAAVSKKMDQFNASLMEFQRLMETHSASTRSAEGFLREIFEGEGLADDSNRLARLKQQKSYIEDLSKELCDEKDLHSAIHKVQGDFIGLEETVDSYERLLDELVVPSRFSEGTEKLGEEVFAVREGLQKYSFLLSPKTFALKETSSYCGLMKEGTFLIDSLSTLGELKGDQSQIEELIAKARASIEAKKRFTDLGSRIGRYQGQFETALRQDRIRASASLAKGYEVFRTSLAREISDDLSISDGQKKILNKRIDDLSARMHFLEETFLIPEKWEGIFWRRLESVSYKLMMNYDAMATDAEVARVYKRVSEIQAFDPESFEFKAPKPANIGEAILAEAKLEALESLVEVLP
jgi:hypothetical protein